MIKFYMFVFGLLLLMNQTVNSNNNMCIRVKNNQPMFYDCGIIYDYTKN
jgi:hypothetical protein